MGMSQPCWPCSACNDVSPQFGLVLHQIRDQWVGFSYQKLHVLTGEQLKLLLKVCCEESAEITECLQPFISLVPSIINLSKNLYISDSSVKCLLMLSQMFPITSRGIYNFLLERDKEMRYFVVKEMFK